MRWLVVVVAVLCVGCKGDGPRPLTRETLGAMTVTDANGSSSPLSAHLTKTTVLAFWAPWCHPCMDELPLLQRVVTELHDPDVSVLALDVDPMGGSGAGSAALEALEAHHIALPVAFDLKSHVYAAVFHGNVVMTIPKTSIVTSDAIDADVHIDADTDADYVARWKQRLARR